MSRWQPLPLAVGQYTDDVLPWADQLAVNYLPVLAERPGGRSDRLFRQLPGCSVLSASMAAEPVRGTHDVEGLLFAVTGNTLYRIGNDGAATSLGTIPGVERVTMAHNQITGGHELAIGNGQSGYVFNTVTSAFAQITDEGFPGFRSVDFIDQYIIGVEPFGRYWFHSDLSAATSYNTLDRYAAEKSPDGLQQVIATGSDVFALGKRSAQFFANTGASVGTFANRPGTEMDTGAASPWTAVRLDNTVYWLGNDGIVYRLAGYQAQRVSTHGLEQFLRRADTSQAFAFAFEDDGHKVYSLTVGGMTFGFDVATNEWHRRKSNGLDFWRMSCLTRWKRRWIGGDYSNGKLYLLDWAVSDEAGEELERIGTLPILHDSGNPLVINGLRFDFDTGMDASSPPLPVPLLAELSIAGDVPDGTVGVPIDAYTYTVSGGVQPYGNRTIASGSLPPGLTMSTAGVVTGTPTTQGSYSWTVQVTDAEDTTATVADTAEITQVAWFASGVDFTNDTGLKSSDGVTWNGTLDANIGARGTFSGAGLVIVCSQSAAVVRVSANQGGSWTNATGVASHIGGYYAASNDLYLLETGSASLTGTRKSSDGYAYTSMTMPSNFNVVNGFAELGSTLIAVGVQSSGGNTAISVDAGATWTGMHTCFSANETALDIATDGTTAVAVGETNKIGKTTNGTTWTAVTSPFASGDVTCIAYGGGLWVLGNSAGAIAYGSDIDDLTLAAGSLGVAARDVDYGGGRFIMVGNSGVMKTSLDGDAWATITSSFTGTTNILGIASYKP